MSQKLSPRGYEAEVLGFWKLHLLILFFTTELL